MTAALGYGLWELKALYQKYASIALLSAVTLHFLAVGGYYLYQALAPEEETVGVVTITYTQLGPPPSIMQTDAAPPVAVNVPMAKPTVGVPVPVPNAQVSPEQTIATQKELSDVQLSTLLPAGGTGTVEVQPNIQIDDPAPDAFVQVEKDPVPVKQVQPEYPEIARRASVEGTVWVKMLIDKTGKVKKVMVVKSDADILDAPATDAAMQWVFTPAMMNSGPVAVWASVPFRFRLNK